MDYLPFQITFKISKLIKAVVKREAMLIKTPHVSALLILYDYESKCN